MTKKSRSERHRAQLQRAVEQGSPESLRALAELNAAAGARALLQAAASSPAILSDPITCSLAASLAARLRAEGDATGALRIASAFRRATPELCAHEALAAFALGHHTVAAEAAAAHPQVQAALAPVLAVISGSRIPNLPAGSSPTMRGLTAMARAVVALKAGKTPTALPSLPPDVAKLLFTSEFKLAVNMIAGNLDRVVHSARAFKKTTSLKEQPRLAMAFAETLAVRVPTAFLTEFSGRIPLPADALVLARMLAAAGVGGGNSEATRVSLLLAQAGHTAFPPDQQAAAALHEGFALASSDPDRAQEAFEQAVALGADLGEALRGRLHVQRKVLKNSEIDEEFFDEAICGATASTAMRLHAALVRIPDAAPFAAVAATLAAELYCEIPVTAKALEAVSAARASASGAGILGGTLLISLLLSEGRALANSKPARALELVEEILKIEPLHFDGWNLRVEIVNREQGMNAGGEVILEAARLGVDPEFQRVAMAVRAARGEPVEFVPRIATAGQLAAELARRVRGAQPKLQGTPNKPLGLDIEACREALAPAHRTAFDLAAVYILAGKPELTDTALQLVRRTLSFRDTTDYTLRAMAAVTTLVQRKDLMLAAIRSAPQGKANLLTSAVVKYLSQLGHDNLASEMLMSSSPYLDAVVLRKLQQFLIPLLPGVHSPEPGPHEALTGIDALLAPHYRIANPTAADPFYDLTSIPPGRSLSAMELCKELLRKMGVKNPDLRHVPPAELLGSMNEIVRLMSGPRSEQSAFEVARILRRISAKPRAPKARFETD